MKSTKAQWQLLKIIHKLNITYSSPNMQKKKSSDPGIFNWSINTAIWLDKKACSDKLWNRNAWKLSLLYFVFYPILFSVKLQLLRSLWGPPAILSSLGHAWPHPMKNLVEIFSLFWLSVYMQKISVIQSFKQEVFVIKESFKLIVWVPYKL